MKHFDATGDVCRTCYRLKDDQTGNMDLLVEDVCECISRVDLGHALDEHRPRRPRGVMTGVRFFLGLA